MQISVPELRLENIVKHFGPTRALDGASLTVRPRTIHALLGENGAGKTTLMRVAFGLLEPDTGQLLLDGRDVRFRSPGNAIRAGIGMVHQHFTNVPAMTVAENVALGSRGLYSPRSAAERVRQLSAQTRLALDPSARVGSMSVAAQQRLEILKALSRRAKILILDEPTAVLAPDEAKELLIWIRGFVQSGASVILITHKLAEALAVADDVTVLRYGRTVLATPATQTTSDALARAMLGSAPTETPAPMPGASGAVVLRLSAVSAADAGGLTRLRNVDLEVRQHEVLGVAGLENSGHELLLRVISHRIVPTSGSLDRSGTVALIPEDRQRDALILGFSLVENVALKGAGQRRGRMNWVREGERTMQLAELYDVRPRAIHLAADRLSGGNQQKLVLGRELSDDPAIVVAENPTRGLDIRASAAVRARLREAAAAGAAIILYSSDLDEVLSLATRVVAVHNGRVIEVPNDREAVGRAMLGLSAN
jgi:ABC-type uncharacterized transport system ATPase subunit